jgi:hypothetical protein
MFDTRLIHPDLVLEEDPRCEFVCWVAPARLLDSSTIRVCQPPGHFPGGRKLASQWRAKGRLIMTVQAMKALPI